MITVKEQKSVPGPAPVWVVAGAPGAGKSTTADVLRRALDPVPALLDKDTLFDGLEGALLEAAGRPERRTGWRGRGCRRARTGGSGAVASHRDRRRRGRRQHRRVLHDTTY